MVFVNSYRVVCPPACRVKPPLPAELSKSPCCPPPSPQPVREQNISSCSAVCCIVKHLIYLIMLHYRLVMVLLFSSHLVSIALQPALYCINCIVLYRNALYQIVLQCIILYYIVLHCIGLGCTVLNCAAI